MSLQRMHLDSTGSRTTRARRLALMACVVATLPFAGCSRLDLQPPWARSRLDMDDVTIKDVMGPQERRLRSIDRATTAPEAPSPELARQFRDLEAAQQLYDAGKYAEAEAAYAAILKKAKKPFWKRSREGLFGNGDPVGYDESDHSPVEEDAIFMIAQCQFKQGHLVEAQQHYAQLLKKFPSTRHLDTTSRQLFRISREWLGFPDATDEELVQVAYSDANISVEQRRAAQSGWWTRNPSRPRFGGESRALESLRLIWLHDAAGPLADDALMMSANYYLKKGNHVDAAQHYRMLREQYPDSPHMRDALMLGSHVALASYNGAGYDPSPLEEAKELKLLALQFPDISPEERQRMQEELARISEDEIEPLWKEVEFYMAKNNPDAVILHCNYLINRYPNSKYARMAMDVRQKYGGAPPTVVAANPAADEGQRAPDRYFPTDSAAPPADASAATPGRAALDLTQPRAENDSPASRQTRPTEPRRLFGRLLDRAESPPELRPVPPQEEATSPEATTPVAPLEPVGRARLE